MTIDLQAFLDAQKKITELQEENKRLKALNLDLNMGAMTTKRGCTKAGKKAATSGGVHVESSDSPESAGFQDFTTNVQKLGQHHQLFWCVILEVSHFSPETCPEWEWDDFEIRFSNSELQKRGPSAELYVALPQEYHDIMALAATSSSKVNFVSKVCCRPNSCLNSPLILILEVPKRDESKPFELSYVTAKQRRSHF